MINQIQFVDDLYDPNDPNDHDLFELLICIIHIIRIDYSQSLYNQYYLSQYH
ncbi:hypothetical protein ABFE52_13500 [Staphylococcus ureilyticus]